MFDLNKAISHWRATMDAQPNIHNSDLDEFEDHVREEIQVLIPVGLTEEEAFLISSRRLGSPEVLSDEFAIADPGRRRSFRLTWMITGALALMVLWFAAEVLANMGTGALIYLTGEAVFSKGMIGLGWVAGALRFSILVLGGLIIWRLLATDRSSDRLISMRGGTVVVLSLLLGTLAPAAKSLSSMFISRVLTRDGFVDVAITNGWIGLIVMVILPVVMLVGLRRLARS